MAKIGRASRVGNIGRSAKRRGGIGSPSTTYGSSQTINDDKIKTEYPTSTTTASP
jgi:hypothetical protein